MKVLIIFGTRPEAIKMAPLVMAFKKHETKIDVKICVTGQHRKMLDQVTSLFNIDPDFDLNLMTDNQSLHQLTSDIIKKVSEVLIDYEPDALFVHGDTTTSFASALAAFYQKIPVYHVEAGLRTGDIYSPWPEEMNRRLTGQIAAFHFCPTDVAKNNLIKENIEIDKIKVTGNTVIDAILEVKRIFQGNPELETKVENSLNLKIDYKNQKLILITGHRRENFGEGIKNICLAIKNLAEMRDDIKLVYPVHLNPNIKEPVYSLLGNKKNIVLLEPQEYINFYYLMSKAYLIVTDSGGIQEEAATLNKPVLVMRDKTERPEGVLAGTIKLVGSDPEKIQSEVNRLIVNKEEYERMANALNPYGDGTASGQIVNHFLKCVS